MISTRDKNEKFLNSSISILGINSSIVKFLNKNNIDCISDLWSLKRNDLKQIGLNNDSINQVIIKMQLYGIDLNKKKYKLN